MRDNFKGVWIPRQHCSFFPRTTSIKISLYLRNLVPSTARHSTAGTWTESRSHKTRPLPSAAPAPPVNPDAAFPPRWPGVSGPGCPRQSRHRGRTRSTVHKPCSGQVQDPLGPCAPRAGSAPSSGNSTFLAEALSQTTYRLQKPFVLLWYVLLPYQEKLGQVFPLFFNSSEEAALKWCLKMCCNRSFYIYAGWT